MTRSTERSDPVPLRSSRELDRLYWLALRQLQRRGVKPEVAADWSDEQLLAIPGFGQAKLLGWRSVFPGSQARST